MPRNRRLDPAAYATVNQPCMFTFRCALGQKPFANPNLADIAMRCLLDQRAKSNCDLLVYCVMPDHLHLVVTPRIDGASSLHYVDRFKGWTSREVRLAGWNGYLWQPRSYDHVLRRDEDLERIDEYILANPVRRGLCAEPQGYRWSGLPNPAETFV